MFVPRRNPFLLFPRTCLVLTGLLALPLLWRLGTFQVNSEAQVLLQGDQRNLSSYQKVGQILRDQTVLVISLACPEVFSPKGIDAIRRVSDAFQEEPGVLDVKSLTHSSKPVRHGFRFDMEPLVPAHPDPAQLKELKRFCLHHPLTRNVMVAADSKHAIILVTYRKQFNTAAAQRAWRRQVDRTLAPFEAEGLKFKTLAFPLVEQEIRSTLWSDLRWFVPVALGLLVVILWATFRSWGILLLVLANQVVALALLPGLIQWTGFHLNVFTVMLIPLLVGVHLTLLAHLFTAFQDGCRSGRSTGQALESAWAEVFKSCAFAALTTAIGLLSLTVSNVRSIREFGWLGAIGIALVFGLSFGPGLSLVMIFYRRAPRFGPVQGRLPERLAGWITGWIRRRRGWVIGMTIVLFAVSLAGVTQLRTGIRAVEFLSPHSRTRQALETLDRTYGGVNIVQIEIDSGTTNGINRMPFLKYLAKVQERVQNLQGISGVYSYAQLMEMMNQLWEGERPGSFRLPNSPLLVNLFVLALRSRSFPFLTALADPTFRTAYLVLRTRDMPSGRYLSLLDRALALTKNGAPPGVKVSAARGIHSILEADRRIIRSQVDTVGFTVLVIGVVLALLWRSVWLALAALATNAVPVAMVVAGAAAAGIALNSITVMVAAVALGIAIDDSVHFITHWREERRRGATPHEAVAQTFRIKARPIFYTSVILIAIFAVFWLSSFPPVVDFGVLSALAFLAALAAVLLFLPALLEGRTHSKPQIGDLKS